MITDIAISEIDLMIREWRWDRDTALREGDAERARELRLVIAHLEYLRERILDKVAA